MALHAMLPDLIRAVCNHRLGLHPQHHTLFGITVRQEHVFFVVISCNFVEVPIVAELLLSGPDEAPADRRTLPDLAPWLHHAIPGGAERACLPGQAGLTLAGI